MLGVVASILLMIVNHSQSIATGALIAIGVSLTIGLIAGAKFVARILVVTRKKKQ